MSKPHVVPPLRKLLKARQEKQKWYHDWNARDNDLPRVGQGQTVRFRGPKGNWEYGEIKEKHDMPRRYIVQTPLGKEYCRNRRHLFPTSETQPQN